MAASFVVTNNGPDKIAFGLAYTPTFPAAPPQEESAATAFPVLAPGESATLSVDGVRGLVVRDIRP